MRRLDMRTTYITLGTIATLGAALAACSGGGGSATTPGVTAQATAAASIPPAFGSNNFTGPTGTVSVTVHIPQAGAHASAAAIALIHAKFGPKHADARVRSMANTAPSSVVRAMGARINAAGTLTETARRNAQYISPGTEYMEFVVTNSANTQYLVDQTIYCTGGTCTGNFAVPVGTNYNVSLFLYDVNCAYLLSAGTTSGVNVTASASPVPVAITLNPVVDYFDVETNANTFVNDGSESQNFTITVTPLDANNNVETTPGVLLNSSFQQITGVSLTVPVGFSDLTSGATQTLTVPTLSNASPTPYGMTSSSYTFTGTSGDSSIVWSAYPVASGSPIVANVASVSYNSSASYGELDEYPLPVRLLFTNPVGFPNPQGSPGYYPPGVAPSGPYAPTPNPSAQPQSNVDIPQFAQLNSNTWAFEFSELNSAGSGYLGLAEVAVAPSSAPYTIPFTGGSINFTDNGQCSGVFSYPSPGPVAFASPDPTYGLIITGSAYSLSSPNPGATGTPCTVTATDSSAYSRKAYFEVFYDSSTLTIQSNARRTK